LSETNQMNQINQINKTNQKPADWRLNFPQAAQHLRQQTLPAVSVAAA
jgi:hypothetical protein